MNENENLTPSPEPEKNESAEPEKSENTVPSPEINDSPENATAEEASASPEESTQAFNWKWTDNDTDSGSEESEYSIDNVPESSEKAENTEKAEKEEKQTKKQRSFALSLSCILSAVSILLLITFGFGLMTGLIPIDRHYSPPTTNDSPTAPDTEITPTLLEDFLNSVVVVKGTGVTSISTGTGVIISANGYIITNYHVIEGCSSVTVELFGENTAEKARVIGYHEDDDVAVLKIDRKDLRAATFVDSDSVRYGEKVYAIGTPEGADYGWSVTQGIVSCPMRQLMIYNDDGTLQKKMNVVQTDASVNHGNSGGPIINVRGEVVGIVTLKRSDSAGMGFALPADGVLIDAEAIIKTGNADGVNSGISMPRPLLGITGVGVVEGTFYESFSDEEGSGVNVVDEEYAKQHPSTTFYAPITGVYVSATSKGADAAKHVKKGDIITEINGNVVATIYQVMDVINEYNGGDTVTIKYYRDGSYYTATVTLRSANDQ